MICYVETLFGGVRPDGVDLAPCTDVIEAFALPGPTGALTAANGIPRAGLIQLARKEDERVLLALGGATVPGKTFSVLALEPIARAKMFAALDQLLLQGGYDGVDLDWEFPRPGERDTYVKFVHALRADLDALFLKAHPNQHALLFLGVSPAAAIEGYDFPKLALDADLFIHFGYDFRNPALGPWASNATFWPDGSLDRIEGSVRGAASELIKRGLPREKLIIALPLYTTENKPWVEVRSAVLNSRAAMDPLFLETKLDNDWVTAPKDLEAKARKILDGNEIAGGHAAGLALWQLGHQGVYTELTSALMHTLPPRAATEPNPPDGAELSISPRSLQWADALESRGYDVYIGNIKDAVAKATPSSPEFHGHTRNPRVAPAPLTPGQWFWRVDSIGAGGTTAGKIWSFTLRAVVPGR